MRVHVEGSAQATTTAAGSPAATSLAKVGPESTAICAGETGNVCASTSDMRNNVPSSIPFVALTTVTPDVRNGATGAATERRLRDGTAIRTAAASAMVVLSAQETRTAGGRRKPGR